MEIGKEVLRHRRRLDRVQKTLAILRRYNVSDFGFILGLPVEGPCLEGQRKTLDLLAAMAQERGGIIIRGCGSKLCIAPGHYMVGSRSDGVRDKLLRGRSDRHSVGDVDARIVRLEAEERELMAVFDSLEKVT